MAGRSEVQQGGNAQEGHQQSKTLEAGRLRGSGFSRTSRASMDLCVKFFLIRQIPFTLSSPLSPLSPLLFFRYTFDLFILLNEFGLPFEQRVPNKVLEAKRIVVRMVVSTRCVQ